MRNAIISLLLLLSSLFLFTGCGCSKKNTAKEETDVEVNTNEEVIKDQEVDGLKLTNTSLTKTDGIWTLVTEVSNNTGSDYELNEFTILIKDSEGNVLVTLPGYVGGTIPNGESRTINSSTDADLENAASVEYSVDK